MASTPSPIWSLSRITVVRILESVLDQLIGVERSPSKTAVVRPVTIKVAPDVLHFVGGRLNRGCVRIFVVLSSIPGLGERVGFGPRLDVDMTCVVKHSDELSS